MNKKIIIIPIIIIIGIFIVSFSSDTTKKGNNETFHITLASPELFTDGKYSETFEINEGEYFFRFVPNGSSPENLSIILNGDTFDFSEDFKLEGTPHQVGASEYFTWDYQGEKTFEISEKQKITIIINPNGNVMGSVSVDIIENIS